MGKLMFGAELGADCGEVDAGHGFSYTIWYLDEERTRPGGITEWHSSCADPRIPCIVYFDVPGNEDDTKGHKLEQLCPLTIGGSLKCRICGNHGFIRAGLWEPV